MLTVMCPNCRHRFPAPGCCSSTANGAAPTSPAEVIATGTSSLSLNQPQQHPLRISNSSGGMLLVDANNLANSHRQQVTISTQCGIQSGGCLIQSSNAEVLLSSSTSTAPQLEIRSKLSGGGCLVQKPDYHGLQPIVDSSKDDQIIRPLLISEEQLRSSFEQAAQFHRSHSTTARLESPPSGCQELPGIRRSDINLTNSYPTSLPTSSFPVNPPTSAYLVEPPVSATNSPRPILPQPTNACSCHCCCNCCCCHNYCRNSSSESSSSANSEDCRRNGVSCASNCSIEHHHPSRCRNRAESTNSGCTRNDTNTGAESSKCSGDVRIQVNATVHLPAQSSSTLTSCTLNITASTSTPPATATSCSSNALNLGINDIRPRNIFNGGGILSDNSNSIYNNIYNNINASSIVNASNNNINSINSREEAPSTPLSWLTPCPWRFDGGYMPEKDLAKLAEVRRVLQTCGWYHEGLSWQQSENLLRDAPVGRWLMRDSSDSRYAFAISVQTTRGPTSVRVFYFMGKFRLDAEPRLALAMPLFDCPIKMLEYYCEYSKRMDEYRREVWVDYSGQVYSQIYLSEPLVNEVRSLSHLARIAVNKAGGTIEKEKEKLPPVIKNYLNEYPYTL